MIDYESPLKSESKMDYGDRPRTELIGLIRETPGQILEVGCSSGATGKAIKQKFPDVKYIGIDSDKESAEIAQTRLDEVIASIPNVQHINNIINLMNGNWRYNVNGGLLDATHVRFFTLNEIVKMFNGTGYDIINCSGADPKLKSDKWPTDFDFGTFVLKNVTEKEASKFGVFQYFIIAQRNGKE
jgi:hypothetical protein